MEHHLPSCATCNTPLQGKYCHACGEKKLNPDQDFSVQHFFKETFEHFTHLDGKLLRTFGMLFFRPGALTEAFINGKRVRYLKPIPLFVIAGVLFYLFFSSATAFFSNLGDMTRGYAQHNRLSNTFHIDTGALLGEKAAAHNREAESLWLDMSKEASQHSKTWLFLLAPVWGGLLWLAFRKKHPWLVPHLIYALHGLAFFVLFDLVLLLFCAHVFRLKSLGDGYSMIVVACFGVYNSLAIRRAYGFSTSKAVLGGIYAVLMFLILLVLYRQLMTVITLMTY